MNALQKLYSKLKTSAKDRRQRETAIVLAFACAITLAFIDKAFHIDEPWFLAMARQILRDPMHPEAFYFNWFGMTQLWSDMSNYPSFILCYPLAISLWMTGGTEWLMRLTFLPFDLAAAFFLYQIAARYLKRPLLPTLIVMATPAYFINMPLLMSEKLIGAFGFAGIYGLLRGVDDDHAGWHWASAILIGTANMVKFSAVFLIVLAAIYALERRKPLGRITTHVFIAVLPALLYFGWGALFRHGRVTSLGNWIHYAFHFPWFGWVHRLRSTLAFTGACGVVTAAWPWMLGDKSRKNVILGISCLVASVLLFLPALDWEPAIPFDRIAGILFSAGALLCFVQLIGSRGKHAAGWNLWMPWALTVAVLQLILYWQVVARFILSLLPPMIFASAAWLETSWNRRRLTWLYAVSFAATLGFSLLLGTVDHQYAAAQKDIADFMVQRYISKGKKVWFTGHWGLQYYMEKAGAEELDQNRGGWEEVHPGDVVLVPKTNTNILKPKRAILSNASQITIDTPIPLRLIHNGIRHAGFYSSVGGFLPYTLSRDPVDEFTIVEVL